MIYRPLLYIRTGYKARTRTGSYVFLSLQGRVGRVGYLGVPRHLPRGYPRYPLGRVLETKKRRSQAAGATDDRRQAQHMMTGADRPVYMQICLFSQVISRFLQYKITVYIIAVSPHYEYHQAARVPRAPPSLTWQELTTCS